MLIFLYDLTESNQIRGENKDREAEVLMKQIQHGEERIQCIFTSSNIRNFVSRVHYVAVLDPITNDEDPVAFSQQIQVIQHSLPLRICSSQKELNLDIVATFEAGESDKTISNLQSQLEGLPLI